ncbi:Transposable element Tc1 transposase-like 9 [Homarus americanus]|uniref:Transposable element Tc1 transposase-like 9 n=1 Tax=Homarus americanus TaxID=6706 RepID=A0A8J5K1C6_HOMAM|nr:Transposable element Tc1 transposase-like 9 [Homarus americanus]
MDNCITRWKHGQLHHQAGAWTTAPPGIRAAIPKTTLLQGVASSAAACLDSNIPPRKPIPGRPGKTTKATDKLLKSEVLKNPQISETELKKAHPIVLGNISEQTIQNHLQKELCFPSWSPAKNPLLMKQRLEFAKKYQKWTAEDWSKVMWSDESTFRCVTVHQGRVRRPVSASCYDSMFAKKIVKHPEFVTLWGCFSGECSHGGLYFLPKNVTMNGER